MKFKVTYDQLITGEKAFKIDGAITDFDIDPYNTVFEDSDNKLTLADNFTAAINALVNAMLKANKE